MTTTDAQSDPLDADNGGRTAHVVVQGECLESIAFRYGLTWETLWNEPSNAQLKQERGDPNILCPGDKLTIPRKARQRVACATGQKHRFRVEGYLTTFRCQFKYAGTDLSEIPYCATVDGSYTKEGSLDGDGVLEMSVASGANRIHVRLGSGPDAREYSFLLGCLDPLETRSGIVQRLRNLGFDPGTDDDEFYEALRLFQVRHGLDASGKEDRKTRDMIRSEHGS